MNKFKVGDTVRCVEHDIMDTKYGNTYTVLKVSEFAGSLFFQYADDVGDLADRLQSRFVLVQDDAVLTPEEVFEHLRKGTQLQLQLQNSHSGKWYDVIAPQYASYEEITTKQWRIKPEPEVIVLNGKKYQEIME